MTLCVVHQYSPIDTLNFPLLHGTDDGNESNQKEDIMTTHKLQLSSPGFFFTFSATSAGVLSVNSSMWSKYSVYLTRRQVKVLTFVLFLQERLNFLFANAADIFLAAINCT